MNFTLRFCLALGVSILLLASVPANQKPVDEEAARKTVNRLVVEVGRMHANGQPDSATMLARRTVEKARIWFGEFDSTYVSALNCLGLSAFRSRDLTLSDSALSRALELSEHIYGREHPKVAEVLYDLALLREILGDHAEAERLLLRGLEIQKTAYSPESFEVATTLSNMWRVYWHQNRYDEVITTLVSALHIYKATVGPQHISTVVTLHILGERYRILGRLTEAEECLLQSLAIVDTVTAFHGKKAGILDELAKVCITQARYVEAESYLKRGLEIVSEIQTGERGTIPALLLNDLGNLYKAQGKYAEAREAYEQALEIRIAVNGPKSANIAEPLNNMGELCLKLGGYSEAEDHFKRALKARMDDPWHGSGHQYLVYGLPGLGRAYIEQGKYSEADSLFRWALENVEKAYGSEHLHVAWCSNALGDLSMAQGKYQEAGSLYSQALRINENTFGPEGLSVAEVIQSLAILYGATGEYSKSLKHYQRSIAVRQKFIEYVFSFSSEAQKLRWVDQCPAIDNTFLSLALLYDSEKARRSVLEMILKGKAVVIDAIVVEKEISRYSYNDDIILSMEKRSEVCNMTANMVVAGMGVLSPETYRDSLETLCNIKDSLETELSRHCSEFRNELATKRFSVSEIADALTTDAVLWEFFRYEPYDFTQIGTDKDKTGAARYLAFTLNHSDEITSVDLGDASEIDSLIDLTRKMICNAGLGVYSPSIVDLDKRLNEVTGKLYDMIFAPLEPSLDGRKEILVSPDGQLSLLPFEILPRPDDSYVIESFDVSYLSSGRDLLRFEREREYSDQALVIADPDFDLPQPTLSEHMEKTDRQSRTQSYSWGPSRGVSGCSDTKFSRLCHSHQELESVTNELSSKGRLQVSAYYGDDALEEVLKGIETAPRVLHVATHGFFCENIAAPESRLLENPLLRSGLALAGANSMIGETDNNSRQVEDGILTALEVSGLNLVGTELVVLSACETGVGDVRNGEGVFGLRRAFQHAGAQSVLMSLWKVPDKETSELMRSFYSAWLDGQTKKAALRESVLKIMKSHRKQRGVAHPYFWGAFVLVGNPY